MNSDQNSDDIAPPELRFRYSDFVLIGTGGMGRVLGAHDSLLDRPIAIKLLPRNSENALAVMRFQQEAKAVSKLNNPHVVQVLDFGYTAGGEPYLVMEHVQGSSLQSCLETSGALSVLESINIAIQLCEALEHAHSNEVIHRDLKPGNIMLEAGGVVKVLDFGLARIAHANETDWRLTRPGQPVGSILYMSPEQVRGEDSDERSDIYSLGLVILKMIIGQLPFEGLSFLEVCKARLQEELPTIPEEAETRLDQLLRINLNPVIQKAIAMLPEDRYQNMAEFRSALSKVIERAKQTIAAEKKIENPYVFRKPNRDLVISMSVVLLLALSAVTYFSLSKKWAEAEKRLRVKHPKIDNEYDAKVRKQIIKKREAMIAEKFVIIGDRAHGAWKASELVTDDDIAQLVGIPIYQISFEGNHLITHKGIETLTTFPIRHLTLRLTDIDDRSMPFINKMNLFYIDFQESLVTDEGIAKLDKDLSVEYFDVKKDRRVTDRGLLHIINCFPNLRLLSISGTGVTKKSFQQISKLEKLETLRACALGLADEDLKCLIPLKYLTSIDIQSNPITINSLETLKKMKLTTILVDMCALISHDDLARMHKELKGTHVSPEPFEPKEIDKDALEYFRD